MTAALRFTFCSTDGHRAFNGINAWLVRFLPLLRQRGHDARALLYAWSQPEDCMTYPVLRSLGVPATVIFPPRTTEAGVRLALRHAAGFRPDLFVGGAVMPALYAGRWLRAAGVPTVAMVHNDDEEYRAKLDAIGGGPEAFRPSAIVAVSRFLARLAERRAPSVRVRSIPYGAPPAVAVAAEPAPGRLRLVYHGRLAQQQKRIQETAAAVIRAARRHPGLEADFYGDGPEREWLARRLAEEDTGGRVRLQGRLAANEVMAMLPRHHAAVLLSDYEGLPVSMLEAMACGLVPVCHRIESGIDDFVTDGENGLLVGDRQAAFDTAIDRLMAEPGLWARLSAAAQRRVASEYGLDATADAWEALGAELRGAAGPRRPIPRLWRVQLPPPHPGLRQEDRRFPGIARAVWRRLRFNSRQ